MTTYADDALAARIRAALREHLTEDPGELGHTRAASAAAAAAWIDGQLVFDEALGLAQLVPKPRALTQTPVFDLASVTKSLVTATLAMQAVDLGLIQWDTPVRELLPEWAPGPNTGLAGQDQVRVMHLLNHSSGLPAWHTFYEELPFELPADALRAQREAIMTRVARWPRQHAPGAVYAYSDLGYIALCAILERVFAQATGRAQDLDELAQARIFEPLGMSTCRFVSRLRQQAPLRDAVTTERCARRGDVTGHVHDENTYVMGGVSGHAGAFGAAADLLRFGCHLLSIDRGQLPPQERPLVSAQSLRWCWSESARGADGHHLGGWDTPSGPTPSAGRGFDPRHSVGHLGFTGTSIWIEREAKIVAVLLTNRVHPTRQNSRILQLRIAFHEAVTSGLRR